ncbi:MAG: hypothetical protein V7459_09770 [Oceanicoccus sp.]
MRTYFELAAKTLTLIATFIGIVVLVTFVFPAVPVGGELLDLKPGYSYTEVVASMEEYGEDGRNLYAWMSPTLDTLFPLVYVTFFAGVIYRFRPTEKLWVLAFIPVAAGFWDLCENAQITAMLIQYPNISESQVNLASTFTQVKSSIFGPVYQLLAIALLLFSGIRFVIGKTRRTD